MALFGGAWWLSGSARAGPADLALNWSGGQSARRAAIFPRSSARFSFFLKTAKIAAFRFFLRKRAEISPRIKKNEEKEDFYKIFMKKKRFYEKRRKKEKKRFLRRKKKKNEEKNR